MSESAGATILHADLDAFFASVEQRDDPQLRGKPVIVGGGVVMAASYEAKARGIKTAMGGGVARRLCPEAIVVPPRMAAYSEASKAVFRVFRNTSPLVEGISIDEAFIDVGGLRHISGDPVTIAERLRRDVREQVGLPITVGVARTKFLAKVASAVGKPDGLLVVPPDYELDFLHPLPIERLWGVGKVTSAKLHARGIRTVGDIAELDISTLSGLVGSAAGHHLYALSKAHDPRSVRVGVRRHSIGSQRALGRRTRSDHDLELIMIGLIDGLGRRLRRAHRVCRTVELRLRFDDFTRATRSRTTPRPTAEGEVILALAQSLLREAMPIIRTNGITLLGFSLSNLLDGDTAQPPLPLEERSDHTLDATLDDLRDRFGSTSVTRAALLNQAPGLSVPLLGEDID